MSTKLASVQPGSQAVDKLTEHGHDSFFIRYKLGLALSYQRYSKEQESQSIKSLYSEIRNETKKQK